MLSVESGAYGVEHYILKGVTDALFLDFETTTLELPTKTLSE
jgi:hypothetical protein